MVVRNRLFFSLLIDVWLMLVVFGAELFSEFLFCRCCFAAAFHGGVCVVADLVQVSKVGRSNRKRVQAMAHPRQERNAGMDSRATGLQF